MNTNYEGILRDLQEEISKLHLKINALAKACKVSLDYQPHDYQVNPIPEEEEMNG